jgi:tetratricopeptide (TPR) repeat protein
VALADSLGLEGPVLNTTEYGGYILWVRGERHLPIQDTRHLGSNEFRSRFVRARLDPAALDSLLADWGFTHAILEPPMDPLDHLAGQLFRRPDWALVFADDAGLLYVRRDRYPAVSAARTYRFLDPDYAGLGAVAMRAQQDTALARGLTLELERARRESAWNARASLWLGLLALSRGQPRDALVQFDRVERLAPVTPGLALRQALAHEQLGDVAGARRAYRRALRDTTDAVAARAALDRLGR